MFNFSRENKSLVASWFRNIDKTILFLILLLFLLGIFFSFSSTSSVVGDKLNKESYFFLKKHTIFVFLGFLIIFFISLSEQKFIKKYFPLLFIFSFLFLLLVPFIGTEIKGSKRWLDLFFLPRFQPIELVKPFFIIICAKIISLETEYNIYKKYFLSFIILSSILFLLVLQPDLGQSVLLFSSWLIMIYVSGFNLVFLIIFLIICLFCLFFIIFLFPYKFGYIVLRLKSFIDPAQGDNYQSEKALEAIISGGFTGRGLGEGILKDLVPEAHTDYIIAVISEEYGALLVLLLIIMFLLLSYKVLYKLQNERDEYIKLVLVGLVSLLLIQTFIHVGVNIRLFPTTGMTLPFLSYGGSSIIGISIISGLILNFTKHKPNLNNNL